MYAYFRKKQGIECKRVLWSRPHGAFVPHHRNTKARRELARYLRVQPALGPARGVPVRTYARGTVPDH